MQRAETRSCGMMLFHVSGRRQLGAMPKPTRARMTLLCGLDVFRDACPDENVRGAGEIVDAMARHDPDAAPGRHRAYRASRRADPRRRRGSGNTRVTG